MHDAAAADDVEAGRVDEARRQDVEVVGDAIGDDGVAGVVAALGAAAQLRVVGEDVDEFAFAFVAPLGAEHDGDGHLPWVGWRRKSKRDRVSRRSFRYQSWTDGAELRAFHC